jgi:hypothetical protein
MRLLASLFMFLLATLGPAGAQPAVDPEALREARAMMDKIGMDALAKQQAGAARTQIMAMVQAVDLGKDKDELLDKIADRVASELQTRLPNYYNEIATVYARVFTLDELKQLNAFYDSPLGKKVLEKMPEILKESSELGQQMGVEVIRAVFSSLQPELQKRGVNIPK